MDIYQSVSYTHLDILLKALYANERLHSRRFSYLCLRPGRSFSRAAYDCLYKSSIGGAVLVRYITKASAEDKDHADGGRETIEILCETMKKYRNKVLTIFCLPREFTKAKDMFYENLGMTSFVELKEEPAYGEQAENFLKMLAKDNRVRTEKDFFPR